MWLNYGIKYIKGQESCIPELLKIGLVADGWRCRRTVIWEKPNPMPESVHGSEWRRHKVMVNGERQDCPGCPECFKNDGYMFSFGLGRPTTAHEVIYLLTKSDRYFYDSEAVREKYTEPLDRWGGEKLIAKGHSERDDTLGQMTYRDRDMRPNESGRNLRSVWTMATQGCPFAHFATFPEELPNKCILAGTSPTACGTCGAPYAPVIEKPMPPPEVFTNTQKPEDGKVGGFNKDGKWVGAGQKLQNWLNEHPSKILAYRRTCPHDDPTGRCIVFDPFSGTNTVGYRAQELGRDWIGIELSSEYAAYGERRTAQQVMI